MQPFPRYIALRNAAPERFLEKNAGHLAPAYCNVTIAFKRNLPSGGVVRGIYGMQRHSSQYPYAEFAKLSSSDETEFGARVRLYGRSLSYLFAKQFSSISGSSAHDREKNRLEWLRRTTNAIERLCSVRSSFDDWLLSKSSAEACNTSVRWACGVATLASLVVDPQIFTALEGIREHSNHMDRLLNGRELHVTIHSTEEIRIKQPSLHFEVQTLRMRKVPRVTSDMHDNLRRCMALERQHITEFVQIALSPTLPHSRLGTFRRNLAEVAMSQPDASDSYEFLIASLYGTAETLMSVHQSLVPQH